MKTFIYLVTNCYGNLNKVYIGKTKNNRIYGHQHKFGKQIKYTVIDGVNSLYYNDWEPLETYWIEQFRAWGFNVVNKRKKGGSGPIFHTNNTKQIISKRKIGHKCYLDSKRNNKISQSLQNHSKHYTKDIIQKMSKPKPEGFGELLSKIKKGKPNPKLKGRVSPNKGKLKYV